MMRAAWSFSSFKPPLYFLKVLAVFPFHIPNFTCSLLICHMLHSYFKAPMGLSCHTQPLFTAGELAPDMTSGDTFLDALPSLRPMLFSQYVSN